MTTIAQLSKSAIVCCHNGTMANIHSGNSSYSVSDESGHMY